jgi:hypothetical protein
MSKKSTLPLVLAIFAAFMALVYIGLGLFLLTTDYGIIARDTVSSYAGGTIGKVFGYVLVGMGIFRSIGAYQKLKSAKQRNG